MKREKKTNQSHVASLKIYLISLTTFRIWIYLFAVVYCLVMLNFKYSIFFSFYYYFTTNKLIRWIKWYTHICVYTERPNLRLMLNFNWIKAITKIQQWICILKLFFFSNFILCNLMEMTELNWSYLICMQKEHQIENWSFNS